MTWRRRRCLRQRLGGGALCPELRRSEVAAVDVFVAVDADGERDDLDRQLVGNGLREVARRIRDDAYRIPAHQVGLMKQEGYPQARGGGFVETIASVPATTARRGGTTQWSRRCRRPAP